MIKSYKVDICVFLFLFIILSLISIFIVQCPDWDFYNYHYYNGWAFFNDRIGTDFLAANFRSYINPIADGINFFLISRLNNHPYIFLSLTSLDNALFLYLIYKITNFVIEEQNKIIKIIILILTLGYVAFTPILFDGYNFSMNDIFIGNFILFSFYLLIKNLFVNSAKRNLLIFLSGISLGIAIGLKLSTAIYCFTYIFCFVILIKKIPNFAKTLFLFIIGMMLSFFILDGYFLYSLFKLYKNPIFPYLNNIFCSKYYNLMDMAHWEYMGILPSNFKEFIFYPFFHTVKTHFWGNYQSNIDYRYAINFISSIVLGIYIFITRKNNSDKYFNIIKKEHLYFLLLFAFISYYCNQSITGVYRFILATSALYGIIAFLMCVLLCKLIHLNKEKFYISIFVCLTLFAYCTSTYRNYSITKPIKNAKLFYNDENYNIEDNSKVIMLNMETSYHIVGQNKKAKYYGFVLPDYLFQKNTDFIKDFEKVSFYSHYMYSKYLENELEKMMQNPNNKIYIIYNQNLFFEDIYNEALYYYSNGTREPDKCRNIDYKGIVHFNYNPVILCEFNLKK